MSNLAEWNGKRMSVIALDPGVTTGYVILPTIHEDYHDLDYGQCTKDAVWDLLQHTSEESVQGTGVPLDIVLENFQYRRHKIHANLEPVKVIGIVEEFARQMGLQLFMQNPSQAVGENPYWDDERLRRLGLFFKGQQHAR